MFNLTLEILEDNSYVIDNFYILDVKSISVLIGSQHIINIITNNIRKNTKVLFVRKGKSIFIYDEVYIKDCIYSNGRDKYKCMLYDDNEEIGIMTKITKSKGSKLMNKFKNKELYIVS